MINDLLDRMYPLTPSLKASIADLPIMAQFQQEISSAPCPRVAPALPKAPVYTISKDLLAALGANYLYNHKDFQAFLKNDLLLRKGELIKRALNSKYPYATPVEASDEDLVAYLCFYGFLLSDDPEDHKLIAGKLDYFYGSGLSDILNKYLIPMLRVREVNGVIKLTVLTVSQAVFEALMSVYAGIDLRGSDSLAEKKAVLFAMSLCSTGLFGVDLTEIKANGLSVKPLLDKSLRLLREASSADYSLKDLSCAFLAARGYCKPCKSGDGFSVISETELLHEFPIFLETLYADESKGADFAREIIHFGARDICVKDLPLVLKNRQKVIQEALKDEPVEEEIIEEPVPESDPLADALAENEELTKKLALLQETRNTLSQKVNDLRGKLKAAMLDNKTYQDQLTRIQDEDLDLPEMEKESVAETISEDDLALLRDLRVVILGGHSRMHQHLEVDNMGWTYISPKEKFSHQILDSADLIIVVTKYISHTTYFSLRSYAEKTPAIQQKILHTSFKNKECLYRQILDWIEK